MKIYRIIKEDGYSLTELDFVKGKKEAAFYLCYLCNGIDYMDIARDLETGSWIYKSDIGEKEFCKKINKLTINLPVPSVLILLLLMSICAPASQSGPKEKIL